METEESREAAWGLRGGDERVEGRAMGSHRGYMSRQGLWSDSGFSEDPMAAVGRSPIGAGGQASIWSETVGAVGVGSGQRQACAHGSDSLCQPSSTAPF